MSYETYHFYITSYPTKEAVMAGFDAIEYVFGDAPNIDTYDVAAIAKVDGKVHVFRKREQAEHTNGWKGAGIGLATGACLALFPPVTVAAGMVAGAVIGADIGIVAGHFKLGVSDHDLKDLGSVLQDGEFGLIVITITDEAKRVKEATRKAIRFEKKELKLDYKAIKQQLDELAAEA